MLKSAVVIVIIINIILFVGIPLLTNNVSYDDFLSAKDYYNNQLEMVDSVSHSNFFYLGILGVIIIIVVIGYFLGLGFLYPLAASGFIFLNIALMDYLYAAANTNFFWFRFFSNPWLGKIFSVIKSDNGVILPFTSNPRYLGLVYIYGSIFFIVRAFLRKD